MTIREAIDHYTQLPDDTKLELSYYIKDMTDDEFTDFLRVQKQDHIISTQQGILIEEEAVAIQIEALAERISCKLSLDFDAVLDLLDRKFNETTTQEEDIVFASLCNDFQDLKTLYSEK